MEEAIKRVDEQHWRDVDQAERQAAAIIRSGDAATISVLRDPSQSVLLQQVLVESYAYRRSVLAVIVAEGDETICWLASGHPAATIQDLEVIQRRFPKNTFLLEETTRHIARISRNQGLCA